MSLCVCILKVEHKYSANIQKIYINIKNIDKYYFFLIFVIMKFTDYIEKFDVDFKKLINKSAEPSFDNIIELNQEQLLSGEDALGQTINTIGGHPYRPFTIKQRKAKGLQTDVVDLRFTGAFYKTFNVKSVSKGFEVTANFDKEGGSILDNFSSSFDFLGLQNETLREWADEYLYPEFAKNLRKEILK